MLDTKDFPRDSFAKVVFYYRGEPEFSIFVAKSDLEEFEKTMFLMGTDLIRYRIFKEEPLNQQPHEQIHQDKKRQDNKDFQRLR